MNRVALLQRKSEEQKRLEAEIADQRKEQRRREAEERKRAEAIEKARQAFYRTPAGRARVAFERGDYLFQYEANVMRQEAIIVAMVGSRTSKKTTDPVDVLNSVCREGWELVNGSFVFVEQGQQSRDKFMSSGQNVAVKGATVGYYLFKRNEAHRAEPVPEPWLPMDEAPASPSVTDAAEEFWTCDRCGTEVASNATVCPGCGDTFDA